MSGEAPRSFLEEIREYKSIVELDQTAKPDSSRAVSRPARDPSKLYSNEFGPKKASHASGAIGSVSMATPKPKADGKRVPVDTERAPTVEQVLNPERPELEGASQVVVLDSIKEIVTDIYDQVLLVDLVELKTSLAKVPQPEPTPFAVTLLAWVVEQIASLTVGAVGKLAAKQLFGASASMAGAAKPATQVAGEDLAKNVGKTAGGWLNGKFTEPRPTEEPAEAPMQDQPGESLLTEFISRQRKQLLAKKHDATTMLALLRESATGTVRGDYIDLDSKLRNLLKDAELSAWFQQTVAMEWMNFLARVSLGPREAGQTTDMPGANVLGGIADGGVKARQKWAGGAGFVEITIQVPEHVEGVRGLELRRATAATAYGAVKKLKGVGQQTDANGTHYNMATLPVYRRVWLQTGSSKLTSSPAFVITPDGQIEIDASNPALAAIGSGVPTHLGEQVYLVGGTAMTDEQRADPTAWMRRVSDTVHAQTGAQLIREMLR